MIELEGIPEKWFIRATNNEQDEVIVKYINETFGTKIDPGLSESMTYWCYSNYPLTEDLDITNKYDTGSLSVFKGIQELTYDEFVEYVVNKKPIIIKYKEDPELKSIYQRLFNIK